MEATKAKKSDEIVAWKQELRHGGQQKPRKVMKLLPGNRN